MRDVERMLHTVDLVEQPDLVKLIDRRLGARAGDVVAMPGRRRRSGLAAMGVAALLVGLVAFGATRTDGSGSGGDQVPVAAADASWLTDEAAMSCVERFTPTSLAQRDFAFDGTIAEVRLPGQMSTDDPAETVPTTLVTFTVHEWFEGGSSSSVTLQTYAQPGMVSSDESPDMGVGARLLVAGDGDFVWGCGFTQPYSAAAAETYADAFGR